MYLTPNKVYIEIIGQRIQVVIDDDFCEQQEADGLYQSETIYLKSSYPSAKEYIRIYRHECFHALMDLLGVQLDHHMEETLAHRVSYMMTYEI